MPNTKSAAKAMRAAARREERNRSVRSFARSRVRQAERLIKSGELDEAQKMVVEATSALDRAEKKGVLHSRNASRRKSRLVKKLNQALTSSAAS